ncbi:hypothetical protein NQ317_015987 [Molorchus minor]|uniref:Uncharacterized protein n=1 Tax=Molorchus minor TaxID=1323400 RepID=A0ABQ9IZA4_9CUCU|nr:hypothetical protein NQ317_015987 [Molorchus minor]
MVDKQSIILSSLIVAVTAIQPNCERDNQFKNYYFSIDYCSEFYCGHSEYGFFGDADLVKIKSAKIIPTCAFSSAINLKWIQGTHKDIRVIASGAFVNLINLESIILPFNQIRELHNGIFRNVSLTTLDLSWNRIIYVQEGAFKGIQNLKHLNLSNNELITLPMKGMPSWLTHLDLSHNFLEMVALNYDRFPNITHINMSHNELYSVALFIEKSVKNIDLTNNKLRDIDFFDVQHCEQFRMSLNKFSYVPRFLKFANIKSVSLYPNPWRCDELQILWEHLQNNLVAVDKYSNPQGKPLCSDNRDGGDFILSKIKLDSLRCDDDSHCDSTMLCRGATCSDVCKANVCDPGSICKASNHAFECSCPAGLRRDPRKLYSPCLEAQCFISSDCDYGYFCENNTCLHLPEASVGAAPASAFAGSWPAREPPPKPWWFDEIPLLSPKNDIKDI